MIELVNIKLLLRMYIKANQKDLENYDDEYTRQYIIGKIRAYKTILQDIEEEEERYK